jgi:hypothetical protein
VVEAATLHRYCGHGVAVEWGKAENDEGKPAQRHRLCAGSLRVREEKEILRFAQDDKVCAQDNNPAFSALPAIPGQQVSQVKKRKRTL